MIEKCILLQHYFKLTLVIRARKPKTLAVYINPNELKEEFENNYSKRIKGWQTNVEKVSLFVSEKLRKGCSDVKSIRFKDFAKI